MSSSRLVSCAVANLTRRVGGIGLSQVANKPSVAVLGSASASSSASSCCLSNTTQRFFTSTSTTPVASPGSVSVGSSSLLPSLVSLKSHHNHSIIQNGVVLSDCNDVTPFYYQHTTTRTMVTRKKRLARRAKRRLEAKIAALKEKGEFKERGDKGEEEVAAPQHEAWVDFQKSLSVKGFQTGQTTKARVQQKGETGQKLRDLKRREKLEMRMMAKRPELADIRGGEYPTKSYSDEETERLLKMAYDAIPKRAGKRGTRNLRRQERRWKLVRQIRAKKKAQVAAARERKMIKKGLKWKETSKIKRNAYKVVARDREYQMAVLKRWVQDLKDCGDSISDLS